jgi:hypothetical protein
MYATQSRVILGLFSTLWIVAAIPAPADDTKQVYHPRPDTNVEHPEGYRVTVIVTPTEGAFSILPVDRTRTTSTDEGIFSILPFDRTTSGSPQQQAATEDASNNRNQPPAPTATSGFMPALASGINTRRPPPGMSSLSGQPPSVISEASVREHSLMTSFRLLNPHTLTKNLSN